MNYLNNFEQEKILNMSWDDVAKRDDEKTAAEKYKENIRIDNKHAQIRAKIKQSKNHSKPNEITPENTLLFDLKNIDSIKQGNYVIFESPVRGTMKYNVGFIKSMKTIDDKIKIEIHCKFLPEPKLVDIMDHFNISQIDQPIIGTIYTTVPKPENYRNAR